MIEIVFKLDENKAIAYDSENKVGECDFEKIDVQKIEMSAHK